MKIELVEEKKLGEDAWYAIYMDGRYVKGSSDKDRAMGFYETLKDLGEAAFITHKKVLLSEEVGVNLQEKSH